MSCKNVYMHDRRLLRARGLAMARIKLAGKLLDRHPVALERHEQMVDEVRRLVADVVMVVVLARHHHLGRLLGDLLEQLVLRTGEQARGIALLRRRPATPANHLREPLDGPADVAVVHICRTFSHGHAPK